MANNFGGVFMGRFSLILAGFCVLSFSTCYATDSACMQSELENVLAEISVAQQDSSSISSIYAAPANDYDEVAKRLAGLFIEPDNKKQLNYAKSVNAQWEKLNTASLSHIPAWSATHLSPLLQPDATTLYYPFGGPDIAYALAFFSHMNNYILVGLEPIGTFDNIKKTIANPSTLPALEHAFSSYWKKGYFITSEMTTQLSNRDVRGALYLILIGLARNGCVINLVEDLSIDHSGQIVARQDKMLPCVRIAFTSPGEDSPKNVYYVRTDLTNLNKKLDHLMTFVKRAPFVTLIKSASYVLHDQCASQMRTFLLKNSSAILQDDTGIPFGHLLSTHQIYPYGIYRKPALNVFKHFQQKDLQSFFSNHNPIAIPFKIGYGFNQEDRNLILALPIGVPATQ
ncbi:MAG: hypothetical protein LBG04_03595 [Holosporaceae bacterium]|nr:hypothetical protein [Holosporaceae bacterium]